MSQQQPEKESVEKKQGGDRASYVETMKPGHTRSCTDPWVFAQVLGDGRVRPCCFTGFFLGFVTDEDSFEKVYNNEIAQRLRRQLLTGELDQYCSICNMKAEVPVEEFRKDIAKMYKDAGLNGVKPVVQHVKEIAAAPAAAAAIGAPAEASAQADNVIAITSAASLAPAYRQQPKRSAASMAAPVVRALARSEPLRNVVRKMVPLQMRLYLAKVASSK